jgi:hypothetical protein
MHFDSQWGYVVEFFNGTLSALGICYPPEVDEILKRTHASLDSEIILALMEAARSLKPPYSSPERTERRRLQQKQRAERAQLFEDSFVFPTNAISLPSGTRATGASRGLKAW